MLRENSAYYPDGVVDTCIIVASLFPNPLYKLAVEFVSKILAQEVSAAIPLTSIIGATHVVTRYLRIPFEEVERRVVKLLETEFPPSTPMCPWLMLCNPLTTHCVIASSHGMDT
jgi:hypothetical protein